MELLVFVDQITPRLKYTFDIICRFSEINYRLTNDAYQFERADEQHLKLVYSARYFSNDYAQINPSELLMEEDLHPFGIAFGEWEGLSVIAFNGEKDILATIFYTITLYSEHLSQKRDKHTRVPSSENILVQMGLHRQLMIPRWSKHLLTWIASKCQKTIEFKKPTFRVLPTFDIDNAYAFKHKPLWRKWMASAKDVAQFNWKQVQTRWKVVNGLVKDPYDTYDYILKLKERGFEPILFWLLGDYGPHDKNLAHTNPKLQELIRRMQQHLTIGIHPSYASNDALHKVAVEKLRLEKIAKCKIKQSRQHFLRVAFPETFQTLLQSQITADYSIGFADLVGFRSGIAAPFPWFNLKKNREEGLMLHPFTYMDGTYKDYLKMSVIDAVQDMIALRKEIQTHGGELIAIWHNETISDAGKWVGWRTLLEETIQPSVEVEDVTTYKKAAEK